MFHPEKDVFGVGREGWDWGWRDELVLVLGGGELA